MAMTSPHETTKKTSHLSKIVFAIVGLIFVVAMFAAMTWLYVKYNSAQQLVKSLQNKDQASQEEVSSLTQEVGKLIVLPEGTPSVATVTDKDKLGNQAFFAHVENGDKLLVYTDAKKAYLYRPSTHQLIDVATLNIAQGTATPSAQTKTQPSPVAARPLPIPSPVSSPTP